jgi:hypothetical protein
MFKQECKRLKQQTGIVTYDQPLFILANDIILATKKSGSDELSNIFVRLGGFHILMSFLGSIGYIMGGSGLEELWSTT